MEHSILAKIAKKSGKNGLIFLYQSSAPPLTLYQYSFSVPYNQCLIWIPSSFLFPGEPSGFDGKYDWLRRVNTPVDKGANGGSTTSMQAAINAPQFTSYTIIATLFIQYLIIWLHIQHFSFIRPTMLNSDSYSSMFG